jgi:4-hydroxybenzoate polyprenyltransferase
MIKQKIYNFIQNIITTPYSITGGFFTILAIIFTRLGIETWIAEFAPQTPLFYFYELLHTTSFFILFFIICIFLLHYIATFSKKTSLTIMLFAFVMIIVPPIIDKFLIVTFFDNNSFFSYYLFDNLNGLAKSFITFFGDSPRDGITYGTRIMIALAIMFLMFLTWLKTKKISRTIVIALLAYTIFFFMSSIPSIITFAISQEHFEISGPEIAGIIASPTTILANKILDPVSAINTKMSLFYIFIDILLILFISYKIKKDVFIALIKNIRPVQSAYHIGLLIIGMATALAFANAVLLPSFFTILAFILLCTSIIFAWFSTVIFNDCVDQKIDTISNPNRPLITGIIDSATYKKIGLALALLSIIITASISPIASLVLILYHSLSFLYNTPPLRLKRFPIIGTFVAGLASFFVVLIGFLTINPTHSLEGFPSDLAFLLIVSYTISLPIKDLKDIAGDKANNIYTIPVLFGEKTGRLLIAIGIFVSLILSVFALNAKILTLPALITGSIIFWILVGRKNDKFIFLPTQTIGLTFIVVSIYALILMLSFFT